MSAPSGWDADEQFARQRLAAWKGHVWRFHWRMYAATDHGGSLRFSARYNRGADQFPPERTWPALYVALSPEICLGEILRRLRPEDLANLNEYRLTELEIRLNATLDCRDPEAIGLSLGDLVDDRDFSVTQQIAAAAIARGAEGVLVHSATGLGDNLVIFPNQLSPTSVLTVISGRDPRLYVPR
ncbi:MAG: RES domain-containing protein [Chloroflexi bacterium]|nr:RES domain-containing protein [Chloroflexota bacterium]